MRAWTCVVTSDAGTMEFGMHEPAGASTVSGGSGTAGVPAVTRAAAAAASPAAAGAAAAGRWKAVVWIAASVPVLRLFVLAMSDGLGANPVEFVERSLGTWTLVALCVVLAFTPLRRWAGWNAPARVRRAAGLACFALASAHAASYFVLDQWFDGPAILHDIAKRPYLTAGFLGFVLLVPLALTSNDASIRRLGGRRWRALHRAVYAVAVLGILHYAWHKAGKNDFAAPIAYGSVIAVLLAARVVHRMPLLRR